MAAQDFILENQMLDLVSIRVQSLLICQSVGCTLFGFQVLSCATLLMLKGHLCLFTNFIQNIKEWDERSSSVKGVTSGFMLKLQSFQFLSPLKEYLNFRRFGKKFQKESCCYTPSNTCLAAQLFCLGNLQPTAEPIFNWPRKFRTLIQLELLYTVIFLILC